MTDSSLLQGSIVALLTPMTPDEKIDFPALEQLIDRHVDAGTSAIVVASTTGEGPTLTFEEHVLLYRAAVLCAEGRIPVIAGVGSPSTHAACELARAAATEQVDAILCVTPYYNRPNPLGLQRHFTAVAEAANTPVILYDVPHRTGVALPEDLIVELSAQATRADWGQTVPATLGMLIWKWRWAPPGPAGWTLPDHPESMIC